MRFEAQPPLARRLFFADASAPARYPLSLHDALPISLERRRVDQDRASGRNRGEILNARERGRADLREGSKRSRRSAHDGGRRGQSDRKSTRLNSSHGYNSYAVFCLKKKCVSKRSLRWLDDFSLLTHQPPRATLFPYTTLFRSRWNGDESTKTELQAETEARFSMRGSEVALIFAKDQSGRVDRLTMEAGGGSQIGRAHV